MIAKKGFDNEKYLQEQSKAILKRIAKFGGKLYLEIGGKIIDDLHASRVLPGFDPNAKIKILEKLKDKIEVIVCVYAGDIQAGKSMRGDLGATSDVYTLKMIDDLRNWGLEITTIVITRFAGQVSAETFANKLERRGLKVYKHKAIDDYPNDVEKITSEQGFGLNDFIETERPLILVVAPAANSGKLGTCLSQLFHEHKKGLEAGYAKWETFPVWNLPLKHPVNMAYEASTADIGDVNMIDPFHLERYQQPAVNYNRDIEIFPVLKKILEKISNGQEVYNSPTDMGVNRVGFAIIDDQVVQEASRQEIIRRFFRHSGEFSRGIGSQKPVEIIQRLMEELNIKPADRKVVGEARKAAQEAKAKHKGHKGVYSGAALELKDGRIITGKNSALFHASSALFLNVIKTLADIPDEIHLLSLPIIENISKFKQIISGEQNLSLNLEETFIALSIGATTNPAIEKALGKVGELEGCEVHLTHIPKPGDENSWRRLRVNLTYEPVFSSPNLFEA